jgi:hypothetical protein
MLKSRWLLILAAVVIIPALLLTLRFTLGGSEDTWLCQDGHWVAHGHPAAPPPDADCIPLYQPASDVSPSPVVSPQVIGGDRDEHGCLIAAGYSWCEEQQKCLRTWEEPCEPSALPSPTPTTSAGIAIAQLLADKYSKSVSQVQIAITQQDTTHARGTVTFLPAGPGNSGLFLAAQVNGLWQLVFDGNGSFSCSQIAPYNFPASMVPDCY